MPRKDLDSLLRHLGQPGRYQILIFFLLMGQYIPLSLNNLANLFIGGKPTGLYCRNTSQLLENQAIFARQIDFHNGETLKTCSKYHENHSYNVSFLRLCENCTREYKYNLDTETTVVGEFELICEDYWLESFSTTIYFFGAMLGGPAFGIVSDRRGRKRTIMAAAAMTLASSFGVTFAPNVVWFTIFRFLVGFAIQGASLTAFTLMMESFSREFREMAGVGSQIIWAAGILLLAGIAYAVPNWRYLQLVITMTVLIALLYPCLVHESLRWLYLNNRFEDATSVVNSILRFNNLERTKKISDCMDYLVLWHDKDLDYEHEQEERSYSVLNLFTSPELRKRLLGMMYIWFTASLWYYVISFAISDFFGSKYLNLSVAGLIDIPVTLATMYLVSRFGCRWPLFYSCAIGGVLSIIAGSLPVSSFALQITRTVFGQLARSSTHAVFNMMLPYASELFPTVIRNNGLGICSFAMRLGGVLAPQIILLGHYTAKEVPFILCGLMGLAAAGVTYILPETRGVPLPETLGDLKIRHPSRSRQPLAKNLYN